MVQYTGEKCNIRNLILHFSDIRRITNTVLCISAYRSSVPAYKITHAEYRVVRLLVYAVCIIKSVQIAE